MSGQWVGSNRSARLPKNWAKIRAKVLKRDGHRCQWRLDDGSLCGDHANQADHVIAGLDDDRIEALQALCEFHHRLKSSAEGTAALLARYDRKRKAEPHPGTLA